MVKLSSLLLRVLLNRYHPGEELSNANFFSQAQHQALSEVALTGDDVTPFLKSYRELFHHIHYSWLLPHIRQFPLPLHIPLCESLPKEQRLLVRHHLELPKSPRPSPPLQKALLGYLYKKVEADQHLPLQYLGDLPLSFLLKKSKAQLVNIIDLLGIYDLANTLRHIVDKKRLQAIYSCLSPQLQLFLRQCLIKKEAVTAKNIPVERLSGDCERLNHELHNRGLARLGKALCGQSPELMWQLTHILDCGRGKIIEKLYTAEADSRVTHHLINQIHNVINFLEKSEL